MTNTKANNIIGIAKVIHEQYNDEVPSDVDSLLTLPGVGSTIIDANGGYSNNKQTLILAVAPTKMYFVIKEGLREIDKNIFYLVCDSYEVSGKDDNE